METRMKVNDIKFMGSHKRLFHRLNKIIIAGKSRFLNVMSRRRRQPDEGASFELRFPTNELPTSVPHLEVAASV
jgi:hypothetical protein